MANKYGPKINDNGLVFCLDAASKKTYPTDGLDVEYLVVAGGGGGGLCYGGGGGGGGFLTGFTQATIATGSYSIVVGAGGTNRSNSSGNGGQGNNSSAFGQTAIGGGYGGGLCGQVGGSGGSGGGGSSTGSATRSGGSGTSGQGFAGGTSSINLNTNWGGGGGGAGGAASLYEGGPGKISNITGTPTYYAGGGRGSKSGSTAPGGIGGGGSGGIALAAGVADATANTGGGGGGSIISGGVGTSGLGGSGVVIIRYLGPPRAKGGDLIFNHRGYTVHVFNSSGSFIVGETAADLSNSKIFGNFENMDSSDYSTGNAGYFSFDGSNQQIVAGSGNSQISFGQSQSFTIEMVFSVSDYTAAQFLMNRGSAPGSSNTDYTLLIESSRLIFGIGASNYTNSWAGGQTTAFNFNNTIMHLCGTIDSTGANTGTKTLYKNGQQLTQVEYINKGVSTTEETGIGASPVHSIYYFGGSMYMTKMYNRALSPKEVLDNFNAIRGRYGI